DFHVTGVQTCALPIWESNAAIEKDIAKLNSLDKLRNISKFIIDEMNNSSDDDIYYFLRDLKDFQSRITIHSFDFNKIKDNQRFRSEERRVGKECRTRW